MLSISWSLHAPAWMNVVIIASLIVGPLDGLNSCANQPILEAHC